MRETGCSNLAHFDNSHNILQLAGATLLEIDSKPYTVLGTNLSVLAGIAPPTSQESTSTGSIQPKHSGDKTAKSSDM